MKKRLFGLIMVFVLALSMLTACGNGENNDNNISTPSVEKVYEIKTDYSSLQYPEKWRNKVKIEIKNGKKYTVKFVAVVDEKTVPLFDLVYGGNDGYMLGTLDNNGEKIDLYIISYDFDKDDFDEDVYTELCEMCQDVNVIISKLVEDGNFELTE